MFPSQAENVAMVAGRNIEDRNYKQMPVNGEVFIDENGAIYNIPEYYHNYRKMYQAFGIGLQHG